MPPLNKGTSKPPQWQIRSLSSVIEAIILTGCEKEQCVFIPEILGIPSDGYTFGFRRLQFSFKFCFGNEQGTGPRTENWWLESVFRLLSSLTILSMSLVIQLLHLFDLLQKKSRLSFQFSSCPYNEFWHHNRKSKVVNCFAFEGVCLRFCVNELTPGERYKLKLGHSFQFCFIKSGVYSE